MLYEDEAEDGNGEALNSIIETVVMIIEDDVKFVVSIQCNII
ncbi:4776_t:CDS:2 [Entrophospora sp. SA101]|nr:4776_t:CDS:2 [Entrophospora sp. SA101]